MSHTHMHVEDSDEIEVQRSSVAPEAPTVRFGTSWLHFPSDAKLRQMVDVLTAELARRAGEDEGDTPEPEERAR